MVTALRTQITTPTNTHITSPESPESWRAIAGAVSQAMSSLHTAYRDAVDCTLGPVVIEQASNEAVKILRANNANTKNKILEGFESIKRGIPGHENPAAAERVTHLCGWLMGFSGILEDPAEWARLAGLKSEHNPWPNVASDRVNYDGKALDADLPLKAEEVELSTETPKSIDPFDKINANPGSFLSNMGSVSGQHFLVVSVLVDPGPSMFSILAGCLKASFARLQHQRRHEVPGVTIIDIAGKAFLGLEKFGTVFKSGVCDRPCSKGLTDEELWHLPVMEGIWQVSKVLKDRLMIRKTEDSNVQFPSWFLVLPKWDAILSMWNDLSAQTKKDLNETWRRVYDHPDDQSVDIAKAVTFILTMGDEVDVIVLMSITCLGSVEDVGVSKNRLNSFLIVVPGAHGHPNGGQGILSALSDSRFQFVNQDNRTELKLAVEQGKKFSQQTGNQYCLVNLSGAYTEGAMIASIPTFARFQGVKTPIARVPYDFVLDKIETPLLNG